MRFVLVNRRQPRRQSFCARCFEPIEERYLREIASRLSFCCHKCHLDYCKRPALRTSRKASVTQMRRTTARS
jgi:hypothetical protein